MDRFFVVALGGALGAVIRYSVYLLTARFYEGPAPVATWIVNLMGCLLIGFLAPAAQNLGFSANTRLFLLVGLLGSFTTFSTFSLESVVLWLDGHMGWVLLNAVGSMVAGIILVWIGMQAHQAIFGAPSVP